MSMARSGKRSLPGGGPLLCPLAPACPKTLEFAQKTYPTACHIKGGAMDARLKEVLRETLLTLETDLPEGIDTSQVEFAE
jgi:hypothetical protein